MKYTGILWLGVGAVLISGCGLMPNQSEYDRVDPGTALEIPPELDEPDQARAVRVPNATYSAVRGGAINVPEAANPLAGLTGAKMVELDGEDVLAVGDGAASVYRRVGVALERLGLEVDDADDSQARYTVKYVDKSAREQRPGVFSRWILRRKGPTDYSGRYQLRVAAHNDDVTVVRLVTDEGRPVAERVREAILVPLRDRLS